MCNCLGYYAKRNHAESPSLTVLTGRSFGDFEKSAMEGCNFCDKVLQSFMLLQYVERGMRVELLLYAESPTELHSLVNKDVYDAVEIYPCSSKFYSYLIDHDH
jgi:hypothetical protein